MNGAKKWNNEQKAAEKAVKDCSRKGEHTQYQIVVDLYYMPVVFFGGPRMQDPWFNM